MPTPLLQWTSLPRTHWRFRTFGDVDPDLSTNFSQWGTDADGDGADHPLGVRLRHRSPARLLGGAARRAGSRRWVRTRFLELLVPRDARRSVQIVGAVSEDLSSWSTGEPDCVVAEDEPNHLLFRSATPVSDQNRQFIRAEITEP